jgi:hypothetical protein
MMQNIIIFNASKVGRGKEHENERSELIKVNHMQG